MGEFIVATLVGGGLMLVGVVFGYVVGSGSVTSERKGTDD